MAQKQATVECLANNLGSLALIENTTDSQNEPWEYGDEERKTGLVYDESMMLHDCLWIEPDESPRRFQAILDRFRELGLVQKCKPIKARQATKDEILLAHSEELYEQVRQTKQFTGPEGLEKLKKFSSKFDGIYMNEHTYDVAMLAAGSCIELSESVLDGKIKNGFALVRTPGHHAMQNECNGFCIFNNAAIVARNALKKQKARKILIVDWDIHHGQGTQSFFYDDDRVMYISIHRYEFGRFWPELIESNFNFTGADKGKGYNINIPLNETGMNDGDYLAMWFNVILPVAYEFSPDLVVISAGYDAAIGCPEGWMRVKPVIYHVLCHSLMSLSNGRVVCLLEGGYNLLSLAEGAVHTLRSLLGLPCPTLSQLSYLEMDIHNSARLSILDSIWALRAQWLNLCLQGKFPRHANIQGDNYDAGRDRYLPVVDYQGTASYEDKPEFYDINGVVCKKDQQRQESLNKEIIAITSMTKFSSPNGKTLLLFDDAMTRHECHVDHPETPERYRRIMQRLRETGLVDKCQLKPDNDKQRRATHDELALVHSLEYIETLENTTQLSDKDLKKMANKWDSIYMNKFSYDCALLAAGCVLDAVDSVMGGKNPNSFAIIRPPGHHAGVDYAAGFCFFNNAVVAGRYAMEKFKDTCKKVLIFDYDVHHGDGVQKLVCDDDRFLYISLHRYDDANAYPSTKLSDYKTGTKNIINIPWNDHIMTETEYILAMFNIVLPCAYEFNPDLVIVSSGFDAAIHDPLGHYKIQPYAYGHFIHHLMPLAGGKLIVCLEGGYHLRSISECASYVLATLLGGSPKRMDTLRSPSDSAKITMQNVIGYHKSHYRSLAFDVDLPDDQID